MVKMRTSVKAMLGITCLIVLTSCKPATEVMAKQPTAAEQLAELDHGIRNLIGSPIAQEIASCKIVTLNAIDCREPASFLLYSIENTNEQVLLTLLEKYNQIVLAQAGNSEACMSKSQPSVVLDKELCIPVEFATE
jgi:hypothetical protein